MKEADLALEVLLKADEKIKDDLIFINEPILISSGINSEIRYNFYYPRWAYDTYREITHNFMNENGLDYYDLWDIIDESEFTNSAIHLTNIGEKILADHVSGVIDKYCENNLD